MTIELTANGRGHAAGFKKEAARDKRDQRTYTAHKIDDAVCLAPEF